MFEAYGFEATEYEFEPEEPITPGPIYGPEYRPEELQPAASTSGSTIGLLALAALGLYMFAG